ncbi:unnamed protein product [Candida verbasci]|uniref:Ribosomal RNA-processing protein 17 n=1 Tax=Candida verbasci TaxID=1227364 RepID=A0A9W4TUC2_9ASCO|nr:unnamed protein product [Candida verbasci]
MARNSNREILTGGKRYITNKAKKHLVDEVVFDKDSRKEYLTGFHKRKLQRQKNAQEFHKEQERLAKIAERKQLRDERKQDLENQLQQFKNNIEEINAINNSEEGNEEEDDDEWTGFDEGNEEEKGVENEEDSEPKLKGILHHTEIYHKDNDIINGNGDAIINDETRVTIESLDNPNQPKLITTEDIAKANNVNLNKSEQILEKSIEKAKNYAVLCGVSKPEPKKKKKFRYLSKTERRENTRKEKSKAKQRGKR